MLSNLFPIIIGLGIGFILDSVFREEGTIKALIELIKKH